MAESMPRADEPPVKVIVAATDLSPAAELAVEQAARLAQELDAELHVLHVFNDGLWATLKNLYDAERWVGAEPVLAARNRLSELAAGLAGRYGIRARGETRTGHPAAEIAAFAREQAAQLLVVGEHGEDWIRDTVFGGTALKVLEQARIPVLLVRRGPVAGFSRVLVTTDFSAAARHAARFALDLLPAARHVLLHAYSLHFEGRMRLGGAVEEDIARYRAGERLRSAQRMADFLAGFGEEAARFERALVQGHPVAAIFDQAAQLDADLIVVGKHGSSLEERLLGSVTQNVLYNAERHVLLVP